MQGLAHTSNGGRDLGLSYDEICSVLPHKPPFVLVDQVLTCTPGRSIRCAKNVTGAESIFAAHFPGAAIYPGAFLLEAMAQAVLLMFHGLAPTTDDRVPVLAAASVRWLAPVRPGARVVLEAEVEKRVREAALVRVRAEVDGACVARGRLTVGVLRTAK